MNSHFDLTDTIAAISTGMSGGIGIVRISGPEAVSTGDKIFEAKNGRLLSEMATHTIHYGNIAETGEDGSRRIIDEALVSIMRAPRTYTGEDVVEINCHGGKLALTKVLEAAVNNGARPAEPGEFTKRAFLNGRIDLSQAEAVMDIISSDSEYALESSVSQLKGSVRNSIEKIRQVILYETAYIESAIDDPENYDIEGHKPELREKTAALKKEIQDLEATYDEGRIIKDGIKTVILGRPNVGKSSLLNALSGYERAIVTDIPGTTRDILEENISLGPVTLRIMDTAGIRPTGDKVEKIGVDKAKEAASGADLILYMADAAEGLTDDDREILGSLKDKKTVILMNKTDLTDKRDMCDEAGLPVIFISAKYSEGTDLIKKTVTDMFIRDEIKTNEEVCITNIRHKKLLSKAAESLGLVIESIDNDASEDFLTIDLMDAYSFLGEITGQDAGEDLVNEIFEKFCMGK